MRFPLCNLDETRDAAPQVQQRMGLDRCLVFAEASPGEKRKTQIDCGRIEGVNGFLQIQAKIFVGIKDSSRTNQDLGEICIDAPVSDFVGIGQGAARDLGLDADMIEFGS